jgi:hypothetical protein
MDEGKPAAVTARDSASDSEQRAEPDVMDAKMKDVTELSFERRRIERGGLS